MSDKKDSRIKAVVMLSGGLDSSTICRLMHNSDREIYALTFDYKQRNSAEIEAAKNVAKFNEVKEHIIFPIDLTIFGGSALTDDNIEVPVDTPLDKLGTKITDAYVPARNTIFLSLALAYAETRGATEIWVGINGGDYAVSPDCRPEYLEAYQKVANLATKIGLEQGVTLVSPLISMNKKELIEYGLENGVDYSMTRTCYLLSENGVSCGHCDACILRKKTFASLGMEDPIPYA